MGGNPKSVFHGTTHTGNGTVTGAQHRKLRTRRNFPKAQHRNQRRGRHIFRKRLLCGCTANKRHTN